MTQAAEKSDDLTSVVTLQRASGHRKKSASAYQRMKIRAEAKTGTGIRLLDVMNRAMAEKRHSLDEAATTCGISTVYLRAIISGHRQFADVDKAILRRIAEYVHLPVAQVFLLADALTAADFYFVDTVEDELLKAHRSMTVDPMWSGYAPSTEEWDSMTQRTKMLLCMLYESATNQRFLRTAVVDPITE